MEYSEVKAIGDLNSVTRTQNNGLWKILV